MKPRDWGFSEISVFLSRRIGDFYPEDWDYLQPGDFYPGYWRFFKIWGPLSPRIGNFRKYGDFHPRDFLGWRFFLGMANPTNKPNLILLGAKIGFEKYFRNKNDAHG